MNRRGLLRLLGFAPIALPTLAASAPAKLAAGGHISGVAGRTLMGECAGESIYLGRFVVTEGPVGKIGVPFSQFLPLFGFVDGDGI